VNAIRSKMSAIERVAFTVSEFCLRNNISRQKYRTLKAEGRGPCEMRPGINTVRITLESEYAWQQLMQEPQPDVEARAAERAVKAGTAAAKSAKHVSKTRKSAKASQQQINSQLTTKTIADQQRTIRSLSARRRKARQRRSEQPQSDST
jgi:hypothetical protein